MFLESLLETSAPAKRRRGWATMMSFLLETAAIGLLILVPMLYTDALPRLAYFGGTPTLVPPRGDPGPKPTPDQAGPRNEKPQPPPDVDEHGRLVLPKEVPPDIWKPKPGEDFRSTPPVTCGDCVPGGIGDAPGNPAITPLIKPKPAEPGAATSSGPVLVSSGVIQGLLIHRVEPRYPPIAIQARAQGPVVLRAIIGRDGTIQHLRIESGHPLLVTAAAEAVQQWRYRPYYLNGQPVEVETQVTVNFVLNK